MVKRRPSSTNGKPFGAVDARGRGSVRIRAAHRGDLQALVTLENDAFKGVYRDHRWSKRQFAYYLARADALVAVATARSGIVGYVAGFISRRGRAPRALLYGIAVHPAHRRRGHARHLLRWFVRRSRHAGCREVVLEVSERRSGAKRLFQQEGFEAVRPLPDHYGQGQNALQMRRKL